ncbi:hypothetical protein [Pontibacterium sp.]|uniref:hypothetical protein n=1 Tax=Pontibacterium sp. TaxID=2036026 RepID=UPI0035684BEA
MSQQITQMERSVLLKDIAQRLLVCEASIVLKVLIHDEIKIDRLEKYIDTQNNISIDALLMRSIWSATHTKKVWVSVLVRANTCRYSAHIGGVT